VSPLVVVDAIPGIPVANPATALVGANEQGAFSNLINALAECLCIHGLCMELSGAMPKIGHVPPLVPPSL
jgi:hypothetical protein